MTKDVFSLWNGKAVEKRLSKLQSITSIDTKNQTPHNRKTAAVTQRIRILAANLAQNNRWGFWLRRFSRQCKQNMAELEALLQFGTSPAVWEIAYLSRKKSNQKLTDIEKSELHYLMLFHDSPAVLRITELKLREEYGALSLDENRELGALQRNLYQNEGIPHQVMDMLWPNHRPMHHDWNAITA